VWVVGTVIPSASGPPGRRTGAARWSPCNSLRLEDYPHSDKEIEVKIFTQGQTLLVCARRV
jgi:hypothetical protein